MDGYPTRTPPRSLCHDEKKQTQDGGPDGSIQYEMDRPQNEGKWAARHMSCRM